MHWHLSGAFVCMFSCLFSVFLYCIHSSACFSFCRDVILCLMLFSVGKSWHVFCLFVLRLMPVPLGQFELFFATIWQLFGFNFCNICISEPCTTKLHTIPTLCPLWRPQPSLLKHLFFARGHDSENMSCLPNLGSFCLVFGFNFCDVCISEPCTTKFHTIPSLCPLWRPQPSLLKHLFFTRNHAWFWKHVLLAQFGLFLSCFWF